MTGDTWFKFCCCSFGAICCQGCSTRQMLSHAFDTCGYSCCSLYCLSFGLHTLSPCGFQLAPPAANFAITASTIHSWTLLSCKNTNQLANIGISHPLTNPTNHPWGGSTYTHQQTLVADLSVHSTCLSFAKPLRTLHTTHALWAAAKQGTRDSTLWSAKVGSTKAEAEGVGDAGSSSSRGVAPDSSGEPKQAVLLLPVSVTATAGECVQHVVGAWLQSILRKYDC